MTSYPGSCHCGAVRFEVDGPIERACECNCSICSRVGWSMASVEAARFRLRAGAEAQSDYQFGPKRMHHLFCRTCGVHAYGRYGEGTEAKIIVNLRCLEGFDVGALPVDHFDGRSY